MSFPSSGPFRHRSSRQTNHSPRACLHPWIWNPMSVDNTLKDSPPLLPPPLSGRDGSKACPPVRRMPLRAVSCRMRGPLALFSSCLQLLCPSSADRFAKCRTAAQRRGQRREAESESAIWHRSRSRPRRANDVSKERGWTQSGTRPGDSPTSLSRCGYRSAFALMSYRPVRCIKHISEN